MMKNRIILLMLITMFVTSCAESTKKTSAKLKLNLSGITNVTSGIGAGGVLLFGKSSTGEQFGKIVNAAEADIELTNGDWSFYAVMWEKTSGFNMSDAAYCGKSSQKLSGTAASVALNLTNVGCADSDFSGGKEYTDAGKIKFAKFYTEECDDVLEGNGFTCFKDNQGSSLSYRMVFKSYTKAANGAPVVSSEALYSQCMTPNGGTTLFGAGMGVNFPAGNSAMPFIVSMEMFLGDSNCGNGSVNQKGVYTHVFAEGIAGQSTLTSKLVPSTDKMCLSFTSSENICNNYFGSFSNPTCTLSEAVISNFIPVADCPTASNMTIKSIKQMVSIPKDFLCRNMSYGLVGTDVFPGGSGSLRRPFKICNEWQLNQIGEQFSTSSNLYSFSYKLMNDLDMNKADFNVAARPSCVGATDSLYKKHHNLNPIGQMTVSGCTSAEKISGYGYTGTFNGNNKTIANGRILIKEGNGVGFFRILGNNAVVKNLNFKNLEVEGETYVGGVVGRFTGTTGSIDNVTMKDSHIESELDLVGAVTSATTSGASITNTIVTNTTVKGRNEVGGMVGLNSGTIQKSSFRGIVKSHEAMMGNIGGIAGRTESTSVINQVFSEGQIQTYLKFVGGIVGANLGTISMSYSNMSLFSFYTSDGGKMGGIAGTNSGGVITAVYSDGLLKYMGTATMTTDGIVPTPIATPSNCISTSNPTASPCSVQAYAGMRAGATILAGYPTEWKADVNNALPRLTWESLTQSRLCLKTVNQATVTAQVATGRGTLLNPVVICSISQLTSLSSTPANRYIVLGEDLNLSGLSASGIVTSFAGIFDGRGYSLYGMNADFTATGAYGIFANNTGKIFNVNVVGNSFAHTVNGATGILAGVNSGVIKNVNLFGNMLQGISYTGQVVGSNSVGGIVDGAIVNQGKVVGTEYVGGVAGENNGSILRSSVNSEISHYGTAYSKIGGITGFNAPTGVLDQTSFSGAMNFPVASTESANWIGGLVGYNSGLIDNSMTKNFTSINVKNASAVGGIAGLNNVGGTIKRTFSTGKLVYSNGVVPNPSNFSQLVGYNSGTIEPTTHFLKDNAGGFVAVAPVTTCSGGVMYFNSAPFLEIGSYGADLVRRTNQTNNGDTLSTYYKFADVGTAYVVTYDGPCTTGESFEFLSSYEPSISGEKSIADFADINTFDGYDIAYESDDPSLARNVDRFIAFHKSRMDGTVSPLTPPVWEFIEDEYPRLLQIND